MVQILLSIFFFVLLYFNFKLENKKHFQISIIFFILNTVTVGLPGILLLELLNDKKINNLGTVAWEFAVHYGTLFSFGITLTGIITDFINKKLKFQKNTYNKIYFLLLTIISFFLYILLRKLY